MQVPHMLNTIHKIIQENASGKLLMILTKIFADVHQQLRQILRLLRMKLCANVLGIGSN